jgi:diguanylate cyclase (GGDEF)-like protein/PAS domain S-box-containing protein
MLSEALAYYLWKAGGWRVLIRDKLMSDDQSKSRALETKISDYQHFFEHATLGLYRSDLSGQLQWVNPNLAQLNGYDSPEEFLRAVNDVSSELYVDPSCRLEFRRLLLQQGKVENFESEIYHHKSKKRVWIKQNAWLVYDEAGQPSYYEGTIEDITQSKRFELFRRALSAFIEDSLRLGLDESFYQRLLERAVTVVPGAQAGSILVSNGQRYRFVAAVNFDLEGLQRITFAPQELLVELEDTRPQVNTEYSQNPLIEERERREVLEKSGRTQEISATLSIPIRLEGQVVAFLNLDNFESKNAFDNDALEMAEAFAKQVATLLKRLKLEETLRERQAALQDVANFRRSLLSFMHETLHRGLDKGFYQRLLEQAVAVIPGAQAGSIVLEKDNLFHFVAAVNFDLATLQSINLSLEELTQGSTDLGPYRLHIRHDEVGIVGERKEILDTAGRAPEIKITLAVPILREDTIVGFMYLDNFQTTEAFDDAAVDMARIFAEQISGVLGRFALEHALQQRQETLERWSKFRTGLVNLTNTLLEGGLDENFYQRLLERAADIIPNVDAGSIITLNDAGAYAFVAALNFDLKELQTITLGAHEVYADLSGAVGVLEGSAAHHNLCDPEKIRVLEGAGRIHEITSSVSLPVMLGDKPLAVLNLNTFRRDAFSLETEEMARALTSQIAVLMQRLHLETELRKGRQDLERWSAFRSSLVEFMNEMLRRGLDESFYQHLLAHAVKVIPGVDAGSILKRQADDRFHFIAALGYDLTILRNVSFAPHEALGDYEQRRPLIVTNLSAQNARLLDAERLGLLHRSGPVADIKTVLTLPVYVDDHLVATLSLDAFKPNAFTQEAQDMASAFATQVGILVQRLTLEQQLERSNHDLAKLANYDALTGLPNRSLFADRLNQALAKARRTDASLGLLFLDLDGFKVINDSLGHSTGDLLLQAVAKRLATCVREADTVARLGGDEFTIILHSLGAAEDAIYVARKVLESLEQPFFIDTHELHISTSIGISTYPQDGFDTEALLRNADTAMYHAKTSGKSRYHFFTPELNTRALEHLRLENDLRHGLERGELSLVYQPRISLQDGRVSSFEALARWTHPDLGNIPPNTFIPIAEKSSLIHLLGREVLRQACQQAKQWQAAGQAKRVAVNLSVKQLQRPDITQEVASILAETGLAGQWLELEITESAAMTDVETTIITLKALRDMGVYISIDDFGTAYSSLNYLKRLPINSLKIDRSFVKDITDLASADHAIVRAVIALGQSLHFSLVAEGVENEVQAEFLRHYGCNEAQGYLFSRPLPASATLVWTNVDKPTVALPTF